MFRYLLIVLFVCFWHQTLAQEFFTWIDSQGRVHNSPVAEKKNSEKSKQQINSRKSTEDKPFLSEDEFKRQQAQDKIDNPAFFTWVDSYGQVHNQRIFVAKENSKSQPATEAYLDDSYVPTLRLALTDGKDCCQQYISALKHRSKLLKKRTYHLINIQDNPAFRLGNYHAPAFYLRLDADKQIRKIDVLQLNAKFKPSVIALDKNFIPIHQSHSLKGVLRAANWQHSAQRYFSVLLADTEIAYLIWYYPQVNSEQEHKQLQLVVRWDIAIN